MSEGGGRGRLRFEGLVLVEEGREGRGRDGQERIPCPRVLETQLGGSRHTFCVPSPISHQPYLMREQRKRKERKRKERTTPPVNRVGTPTSATAPHPFLLNTLTLPSHPPIESHSPSRPHWTVRIPRPT